MLPGLPPPCCAGTSARFRSVTTNRLPSPGTLDASTIPPCDERAYAITEDGAEGGAVFSVSTPREDGRLLAVRARSRSPTARGAG